MPTHRQLLALVAIVAFAACDAPPTSPAEPDGIDARLAVPTTVVDLGTLGGGWSHAMDVNNRGVIVGSSRTADGSIHAFRWTKAGGMQDLGTLGGSMSEAIGITTLGYIAGSSTDASGGHHLVMWTPAGRIRDLGALPDYGGTPEYWVGDINDHNEIVGSGALFDQLTASYFWSERTGLVPYPWGSFDVYTEANNNNGDVVGWWCCGNNDIALYGGFFVKDGTDFIDMGGVLGYSAYPYDVNDGRVVVGNDYAVGRSDWETNTYDTAPFKWTRQDGYRNLGSLGGRDGSAFGVNRYGEIVGLSTVASGEGHAFFWSKERGLVDLGPGGAVAINDELPWIVGGRSGRATLWIGSGGVAPVLTSAAQPADQLSSPITRCFHDERTVRSKSSLLACLASDGS